MTSQLRTNVREAMQRFAATNSAFDSGRIAAQLGVTAAEVEPEVEYLFWDGALIRFSYRRHARTGLSPLFTAATGELPGIFVESPPNDARPPESMPRDWIVEAPNVLFHEGERAAFEASQAGNTKIEIDECVHVEWRRSPTGRFNIARRITIANPHAAHHARRAIMQVVHVDPALRGVTVRGPLGDLPVPLTPGAAPPALGELVSVEWNRSAPGQHLTPSPPQRLRTRTPRYFPGRWLATVSSVIGRTLPSLDEVLEAEGGESIDVLAPLALSGFGEASVHHLLDILARDFQDDESQWLFTYDYKDVPTDELAARLGVAPTVVENSGEEWASALNSAAMRAGKPLRVHALEGDGDDRMVAVLSSEEWNALVAAGCVPGPNEATRHAMTIDEARVAMLPRWDDDVAFLDYAELHAFLVSQVGQFVATTTAGLARFELPTLHDIYVTSSTADGAEWITLSVVVTDEEWTREELLEVTQSIVSAGIHVSADDETLELRISVPMRAHVSPRYFLSLVHMLHVEHLDVRRALGIES